MNEIIKEYNLLNKIFYKSKNQFKSSILLSRLNELRKKTQIFIKNKNNKIILKNCCINLYIAASNYFIMGHFNRFCLIIFGICGRIYNLIDEIEIYEDEIESIFKDL